jgi:hypothetical protein
VNISSAVKFFKLSTLSLLLALSSVDARAAIQLNAFSGATSGSSQSFSVDFGGITLSDGQHILRNSSTTANVTYAVFDWGLPPPRDTTWNFYFDLIVAGDSISFNSFGLHVEQTYWADWVLGSKCYVGCSTTDSFYMSGVVSVLHNKYNNTYTNNLGRDYVSFVADFDPIPAVPVPAAAWLMGSGLIGLAGIARRKK